MVDPRPESESYPKPDPNIHTYNSPEIANYYAALDYLTPCERLLFDEYLRPGMDILDLGVGGGRTSAYLSSIAKRYVGADYAPEMVAACRKKFPRLEFETAGASDLSKFTSSSFDAVVMAFNVIDYVSSDEARHRALREIRRVLKPEGILIFSTHNPRAIWVRVTWNPQRVRNLAESIVGKDSIFRLPLLQSLTALRVMVAALQSVLRSLNRAAKRLPRRVFWRGEGYGMDSAHGGLKTHFAIPRIVDQELGEVGFRLLRVVGDDCPRVSHPYITDWYYYVFCKIGDREEK